MLLSPFSLANGGVAVMATLIANIVIHILFAVGVYRFAKSGEVEGRRTWLVGPWGWCLATLVLGPLFAVAYWLVHHSSLGGFSDHAIVALRERRLQRSTDPS